MTSDLPREFQHRTGASARLLLPKVSDGGLSRRDRGRQEMDVPLVRAIGQT